MNPLLKWGVIIGSFLIWQIISPLLYVVLLSLGLPQFAIGPILGLAQLIFIMEIVFRILFCQVLLPLTFIPADLKTWPKHYQDELVRHTTELEKLGFIKLMDFTSPSMNGAARLLGHPENFCFAEIGQVGSIPVTCTMFTFLEDRWALRVTNAPNQKLINAVWFAFLRQPRTLGKRREQSTTLKTLLQVLLEWRQQTSNDLNLKVIQEISAETFFDSQHQDRKNQTAALNRKSMVWSLMEMVWSYLNPQSAWLGDYEKLKKKRLNLA
jgi:hypothetical protein